MQRFLNAGALGNIRASNREYIAEFFGTFVFVSFIIGVVQQCKMEIGGYSAVGNTICWGVGFGFMLGLYMCAGISGGHINPAITLTMAVNRGFPWKKVPWYIIAQVLGAFCAALLNYTYFHAQIVKFENGHRGIESAGLFAAFLPDHMSTGNAFYAELVDTAFFAASIFAITDKLNAGATHYAPLALGMMITGIGLSFGSLTGYSMNPARDMGPRIFMSIAGWGDIPWVGGQHFFWVPWIGPALGAVIGGFLYEFFACSTPKNMFK
ncbi:aquaporin [Basidiobolus meristosporus CBS 931.73]|uniref:Aquaporin n=1 Tax=Basidiobolus meristosporus CBS 931.73 TaxID=1314790 RepID=A0A1Y1YY09_9FUNG|nr:aquaporin [Basidiobolus meristosporus CBS 931.73]|eukprot:ORY02826.1 aquaporin [Basidiobolus meristosporus CBS 931.73]